jgi:hypothetical protein
MNLCFFRRSQLFFGLAAFWLSFAWIPATSMCKCVCVCVSPLNTTSVRFPYYDSPSFPCAITLFVASTALWLRKFSRVLFSVRRRRLTCHSTPTLGLTDWSNTLLSVCAKNKEVNRRGGAIFQNFKSRHRVSKQIFFFFLGALLHSSCSHSITNVSVKHQGRIQVKREHSTEQIEM